MKTLAGVAALFISVGSTLWACSEANFGSNAASQSTATRTGTGTGTGGPGGPDGPDGPGGGPDGPDGPDGPGGGPGVGEGDSNPNGPGGPGGSESDCVTGDAIKFKYDGPIQKCIDEGKLWNFDSNVCTKMKAASFDCSFDEFFKQLDRIDLKPSSLLQQGKDGKPRKALIMGCGESENQKTILIQWFFVPEGEPVGCTFKNSPGLIITGCYGEKSGPATASEEEKKRIVLNCMNDIAN